ncbi:ATP-binding protein [Streptomyces sp. BH055]|uniref:ATP-binding protein n=1 Tax=Streptomyces sp. BH055 TaxID=3401173 RepID=UPI003BB4B1DF
MTTTAARSNATGTPGYSETMPCEPGSARRARLLISTALNAWGLGTLTDAGTLIVSELVANVISHTRCRVARVAVTRHGTGAVRIAVGDTCLSAPTMTSLADDSGGGRGLFLVDAMSDRWGYDLHRASKVVWAELGLKPEGTEP